MSAGQGEATHFLLGCRSPVGRSLGDLSLTSKARVDPTRLAMPLTCVKGIGSTIARRLHDLGLETTGDLLLHLPFRHEEPSRLVPIAALAIDEEATLRARVSSCALRETRRRRVKVLEALLVDDTGSLLAVWYNQPYLEPVFACRPEVLVRGSLTRRRGATTFVVKRHEVLAEDGESLHMLGFIPVYPTCGELSVRTLRTLLHRVSALAADLVDPVPSHLLTQRRYLGKADSVLCCHFPETAAEANVARDRLAFEELLLLQVAVLRRRREKDRTRQARALGEPADISCRFVETLPYMPTRAQTRVIGELEADLRRPWPMQRLLHGDVGSGKTMVATYCMLRAVEAGGQAAMMAPTEVLAEQHAERLAKELEPLGVQVGLITGSQRGRGRARLLDDLAAGGLPVVVGTHALIQEGVAFRDLRVAVIDEQHRFGVRQREAMSAPPGGGLWPHTLHMSATPIPRTMSLTLYGDLDVSVLDELPPGRQPVKTRLVFAEDEGRMWAFARAQLDRGRQMFVVCPLIEESEALQEMSAVSSYDSLRTGALRGYRLGLLHGQLPSAEKTRIMAAFGRGDLQVLVSTSVIEVGVDVASACVMVIEGARRFGLSQLHQLRGRVGRAKDRSFCFLKVDRDDPAITARLAFFARTHDGFVLAEADMLARGEGELFGERQSGLGDLQVASLIRDRGLLEDARVAAAALLDREPDLAGPLTSLLGTAAMQRFGDKMDLLERL